MNDLKMLQLKFWRKVSKRRADKLRKRGEFVKWSRELGSYIWDPDWEAPNQETPNGLPWVDHKTYLEQSAKAQSNKTDLTGPLALEAKRQRMRNAVKLLSDYMSTYTNQAGYEDYSDKTFIDDVLYGLGIALQPEKHRCASGYDLFKKQLREHLGT